MSQVDKNVYLETAIDYRFFVNFYQLNANR